MYDEDRLDVIRKWLGFGSINIFGRPFSGKDAQGMRLAHMFDGVLIGSGDILRNSRAEKQTRTGQLTPTEDFFDIVLPYFKQECPVDKPLIMSSVGRWHGEEDAVIKSVKEAGHPLMAVIYLELTNAESHKRWAEREINNDRVGRHDDTEEVLETRFAEFENKTVPVIDYYRSLGLLVEVDGKQSRDKVTAEILDSLFAIASASI
jgi:adenylate kinase